MALALSAGSLDASWAVPQLLLRGHVADDGAIVLKKGDAIHMGTVGPAEKLSLWDHTGLGLHPGYHFLMVES